MMNFEDIVKFWQDKKISSIAELEAALWLIIQIENNAVTYNDTREIFEHDSVIQYTGDLRTLLEIRNSKDAFAELLHAFEQKVPLDKSLILRFHWQLTKNIYDQIRSGERPARLCCRA